MKKKKRNRIQSLISFLLVIIIAAGTVYIAANWDSLKNEPVFRLFNSKSTVDEKFVFDAYSDNVFAEMDGRLLVASSVGFQLFDHNGAEVSSAGRSFSSPAVAGGQKKAIVWDVGGTNLSAVSADGRVNHLNADRAIISVKTNNNGWYAVSSEETGYKGTVTVYNNNDEVTFKWNSSKGYVLDAAVSPSSTRMAALTLTGTGSRIVIFNLDSKDESAEHQKIGTLYCDIAYLSENRICAVSENAFTILDQNGEEISEYLFSDEYIRNYSLSGDGYIVLVLGKYRAGNSGRLVVLDLNGRETGSSEINTEVYTLSANGKNFAVSYSDRTVIYNNGLNELGFLEDISGVRDVLMCRDKSAIIVSSYGAAIFKP